METFSHLLQIGTKYLELKTKFQIVHMKEAVDFLERLPAKAKDKVVYNIGKSMYSIDIDIFK